MNSDRMYAGGLHVHATYKQIQWVEFEDRSRFGVKVTDAQGVTCEKLKCYNEMEKLPIKKVYAFNDLTGIEKRVNVVIVLEDGTKSRMAVTDATIGTYRKIKGYIKRGKDKWVGEE